MDSELKVMHGLSEVAGQNSYSVMGLKKIGIEANCIVYQEHPFKYPYDKSLGIDKARRKLFPFYALKLGLFFIYALKKYNTFHFHFGRSILNNIELPIYDLLHKKLFYEFHGSDLRDYKRFCDISGMPYDPAEETSIKLHIRNSRICKKAQGIIVHDDELIPYLPETNRPVYVVPLRVDLGKFEPVYPTNSNNRIRIVHAPSKRAGKGTKYVMEIFNRLKKKYNNIELILVEGKSQQEALKIYKTADIIVDQLFAGTYGVFAIESMALGKPVITYISDEMKKKLPDELPIVSGDVNTLLNALELLINDSKLRRKKGEDGRRYVENYHDYRSIAYVLTNIYLGKSVPKSGREAFEQVKQIKNQIMGNGIDVQ